MSDVEDKRRPTSKVDYVVDENASKLDLPEDTRVAPASEEEHSIASTGPTNWWRAGLVALAIVVALMLALQLAGGWPGTDVQPGTPVAQPETVPDAN